MSRDTGDPHLNAQAVRDMEAHSGKKASPNVTGRLWTRLRTIAQTRVEGPVDEAVEAGAKLCSYDPTTFLADFHATKSRQMARPDQMFEVVIRAPGKDCILACMDCLPSYRLHAHGQLISRVVDEDVFRRPDKHSMYEWLSLLRSRLLDVPADAVVALCFTAENPKAPLWARSNTLSLLPRHGHRRDRIPREAMIYMTSSFPGWNVPAKAVKSIANPSVVERYLVHPQLPSMKPSQASNDADLVRRITWPHGVTKYKGDLDMYIWRPHSKMPSFAYADLYMLTKSPSQLSPALILFSTTRVLQTFKQEFTLQLLMFSPTIALNETRDFIQDVKQEILDMSLQSRVHPSKERFQYLLYLSDGRKYAVDHMARNKVLLDEVQRKFKSIILIDGQSQEGSLLEELVGKVKEDLDYVEEELAKIGNFIDDLRKEIEAQSSLQSRMPTMITILAATYVPLAFVTSFLGMNISRESASTWLSSTAHNQSSNNSISTDGSIPGASSEDDPSPQVWDLRWFAILSAPLLFGTIILPLATGPVIRSICQSYVRLRIYWVVVLRVVMVSVVFVVYVTGWSFIATVILGVLLIAVAILVIWNAQRHPWPRYFRIMWGLLLLALSIVGLATHSILGLLGWVLNFAGMAYDSVRGP